MSKKTRWILFGLAIVVFFVLSYLTIVFALGYKYDFSERAFVRMGSFRMVANTCADVTINGKPAGGTSFLGNTFSKTRLLPRTYAVSLDKEDYHPWQKKITVSGGLFTDFPKVVLVPLELPLEQVATGSFGFQMLDDKIRETKGKLLSFDDHDITIVWTSDTDYQPFHREGDTELLIHLPQKINDVQWYKDHDHIFVSTGGVLYFYEIDRRGGLNPYELSKLTGPFFYDSDTLTLLLNKQLVKYKVNF